MKKTFSILIVVGFALTFTGCAKNPVSGKQDFEMLSEAQEISLGRKADAEEHKQIKPLSLQLITANNGDSYVKLAQNSVLGKNAEKYLRLINAQYPQGKPNLGQSIKIVE